MVHSGEYQSVRGAIPNYVSVGILREILKLSGGVGVDTTVKLQHKLKFCVFFHTISNAQTNTELCVFDCAQDDCFT